MRAQSEFRRRRSKLQAMLTLLLIILCAPGFADTRPPTKASGDLYQVGHEFLLALYPELSGKRYVVSIESAVSFDDPAFQGMVVPVFYDSALPENHVAMCASFYDVI